MTKTSDIGDVVVMRSPHESLSTEATRVAKLLPKFISGREGGKAVSVWYTLSVNLKFYKTNRGFVYNKVEQMLEFPGGKKH